MQCQLKFFKFEQLCLFDVFIQKRYKVLLYCLEQKVDESDGEFLSHLVKSTVCGQFLEAYGPDTLDTAAIFTLLFGLNECGHPKTHDWEQSGQSAACHWPQPNHLIIRRYNQANEVSEKRTKKENVDYLNKLIFIWQYLLNGQSSLSVLLYFACLAKQLIVLVIYNS